MSRPLDQTELVLVPGRRWPIVGIVFFGGSGVMLVLNGDWVGWPILAIGALCFATLVWAIFSPNSRLRLSPQGFRFGSMRRVSSYLWSDVSGFFPVRFGGNTWVCFVFSARFTGEEKLRRINQQFGKFDRFLPNNYGLSAMELAQLMESWRIRFGDLDISMQGGDELFLSE